MDRQGKQPFAAAVAIGGPARAGSDAATFRCAQGRLSSGPAARSARAAGWLGSHCVCTEQAAISH